MKKPKRTSGRLSDRAELKRPENLKGIVGETVGFEYAEEVQMVSTDVDNKPRCVGCGYEFKLLTAMGIGPQKDMYCKTCEESRKRVADWKVMDARVKSRIFPKVKGFSWVEQVGRTL